VISFLKYNEGKFDSLNYAGVTFTRVAKSPLPQTPTAN